MGDASQLAIDAMYYIGKLSPLLLLIGAISFADLVINQLVSLVKKGKIKW